MDIQTRIARDGRADRINELIKRCRFRFIQAHYAFSLVNDRLQAAADDRNRDELRDILKRSTKAMDILNGRTRTLSRAYIATVIPSDARHA
ncbi:MAG: hypothetical protein JSS57_04440 [Proteobacteria bacterium]|nr:hypothetical protein [Pseudomonadota bacterium]